MQHIIQYLQLFEQKKSHNRSNHTIRKQLAY